MKKVFDIEPMDLVWFMYEDKPTAGIVEKVWSNTFIDPVDCESVCDSEKYFVKIKDNTICTFEKEDLFRDKEELKKSL